MHAKRALDMTAISIAMIVRNEADHLPECIVSAAGLADEVCVVDTGSSDETVAIARRLGCRIGCHAWSNDFAAARNASLALCTCPWIFIMDADERLAPEDAERIKDLAGGGQQFCYRFPTRNYTNNTALSDFTSCADDDACARGFAGWHPSWKVRLFPNLDGAKFSGAVHELVHESLLAMGVALRTVDIPVHHYPLLRSEARIAAKQELYLALGLQKARQHPNLPQAHAELGAQYVEMKRYAEALQSYRQAMQLAPENSAYLIELGGILHLMGHWEEARTALELATRRAPDAARAWRNLGVVHASREAWESAARCFEQACALAPGTPELEQCLLTARRRLCDGEPT